MCETTGEADYRRRELDEIVRSTKPLFVWWKWAWVKLCRRTLEDCERRGSASDRAW